MSIGLAILIFLHSTILFMQLMALIIELKCSIIGNYQLLIRKLLTISITKFMI